MKIEKINDNQIKCTLNRSDLLNHKIKISELAYGTDNAKELFRDMMEEASERFGFEADDIPLMIEAIPVSPDCVVLLITKVTNPEELDEKMARFAPSRSDDAKDDTEEFFDDLDEFFPLLDSFENRRAGHQRIDKSKSGKVSYERPILNVLSNILVYSFDSLSPIIKASKLLDITGVDDTALYRSPADNRYYLIVHVDNLEPDISNSVRATLDEFGVIHESDKALEHHYKEHFMTVIDEDVFGKLSQA